jgi:hypothetical protein
MAEGSKHLQALSTEEGRRQILGDETQRQAAQIYGLLAKLLCKTAVYEICELHQSHFAASDDLLAPAAKKLGQE